MTAYVVLSRERMRNRVEYEIYREKSRPVNASRTADPIELAVLGVNCFYDHPPRAELRWRASEVVRTPMLIMDAAGVDLHRPGFCCATDATARDAVRDARREMIDRATTAWRNDARRKPPDDDDDDEDDERERHSDDARGNADARASYDATGGGPWMFLSPTLAPGRKS